VVCAWVWDRKHGMLGDQHKFMDREEQRRLEGYRNV
jgi:hypothetical protein